MTAPQTASRCPRARRPQPTWQSRTCGTRERRDAMPLPPSSRATPNQYNVMPPNNRAVFRMAKDNIRVSILQFDKSRFLTSVHTGQPGHPPSRLKSRCGFRSPHQPLQGGCVEPLGSPRCRSFSPASSPRQRVRRFCLHQAVLPGLPPRGVLMKKPVGIGGTFLENGPAPCLP